MPRQPRDAPVGQRLFFALWPDRPARAALARLAQEIARDGQGRAPRAVHLHVTLAFLAAVDEGHVPAVIEAGRAAAEDAEPFGLALERVGGNAYGVAWLTPHGVPAPLRALHETLADRLRNAGFALERRMFRPHVTLARDCARPAHRGSLPPIAWPVERLSLVASMLAPGGSQYREVESWPLRGR